MKPPKYLRWLVYPVYVIRHRLTCHWCYGDWFTFFNRKQTGRGAADAALVATFAILAIAIIAAIIGSIVKNGA